MRKLLVTTLFLSASCAYMDKPNPEAASNPSYLNGKSLDGVQVTEIMADLSRDVTFPGTRVTATLITEPLVRLVETEQAYPENLTTGEINYRIQADVNSMVKSRTCFYVGIRSTDVNAPNIKYWSAYIVDENKVQKPLTLTSSTRNAERVALKPFSVKDIVYNHQSFATACSTTAVKNLSDVQMVLKPRFDKDLANKELNWFTDEKIVGRQKEKLNQKYSAVKK